MFRAFAIAMLAAACVTAPRDEVAFIRASPDAIETTHALRYEVRAAGFRVAGPTHRVDSFEGHPYEISLAALIEGERAVLVHAERVADGSGASDYRELPPTGWPTAEFRRRAMCVTLSAEDIAGEHDLEWLRDNGFDPVGVLALEQSFVTTDDHNAEVVVTLAAKVADCEETTVSVAFDDLRNRLSVRALG